jgi:hypothetical protein
MKDLSAFVDGVTTQSAPRRAVDRREVIAKYKTFIKESIRNFCAENVFRNGHGADSSWDNDATTQTQQ